MVKAKGKKGSKTKKRTRPLDPGKDFNTPVRKPKKETKQRALFRMPSAEPTTLVQNGRMAASYVKPHFERNKKGDRFVSLEVSMHLTKAHDGMMPKQIEQGWDFLGKEGYKRLDVTGVKPQAVTFHMDPKMAESQLELPAARVTHVSLQVIEEKGTGKANKIIRLSFRLKVQLSRDVAHFSEWNFGDNYWIMLAEAQGNLLEENGDDEEEAEQEEAAGESEAPGEEAAAPGA